MDWVATATAATAAKATANMRPHDRCNALSDTNKKIVKNRANFFVEPFSATQDSLQPQQPREGGAFPYPFPI